MVAAGHPVTAEAGARVLRAGGNAVDAAIGAMLASWTAEPLLTGPGAGGYLLVAGPDWEPTLLDFFVAAPGFGATGDRAQLVEASIDFDGDAVQTFHVGAASCGAYGNPAGVAAAVERWGSMPLAELAEPAARLAREGVDVTPAQGYLFALLAPIVTTSPEGAATFLPGGRPPAVGERFALPGDTARRPLSTEHALGDNASRSGREARVPGVEWSTSAFDRWRRAAAQLPRPARRDGGGRNAAAANPPLYYGYEAIAYRAAYGTSIFGRLYAMRVWSALLLLVTTTAAWLLAGELLGRSRPLQLAAAAVVGLAPMTTFMTASVNPDAMLYALWSLALWLGVRILRRGLSVVDAVGLLALCGLAVTTKATSYALIPPAVLVLAVGAWRLRRRALRPVVVAIALAAVAFALPAAGWVLAARSLDRPALNQITAPGESDVVVPYHAQPPFNPRGFVSYLRQFYLPDTGRGALFPSTLPVYSVWFKGALGTFGWRQFRLAPVPFFVLAALCLAAFVAAALSLVRGRVAIDWPTAAFLALAVLGLLLVLHITEYRIIYLSKERDDFNQGRYLLPLVSLGGVAVGAALAGLRERRRAHGVAGLLGGLIVLQLLSLGTVAEWFYG
jgi:hypothetical protein